MFYRRTPDWLLMLLGLYSKTPRGLAARYADSAHRSGVLKPLFADPDEPLVPAPSVPDPAPLPTAAALGMEPAPSEAAASPADSSLLRAA